MCAIMGSWCRSSQPQTSFLRHRLYTANNCTLFPVGRLRKTQRFRSENGQFILEKGMFSRIHCDNTEIIVRTSHLLRLNYHITGYSNKHHRNH